MLKKKPTFQCFLSNVNDFIGKEASKKNTGRSYIRLFRPYNTNTLNILGSFSDAIKKEKPACNNFTINSRNSFGMIALEQFTNYCLLSSKYRYIYEHFDNFKNHVDKYYHNFVIEEDELKNIIDYMLEKEIYQESLFSNIFTQEELTVEIVKPVIQKALYARCLASAYNACSFTFDCRECDENFINAVFSKLKEDLYLTVHIEKDLQFLTVSGIPRKDTFNKLNKKIFMLDENGIILTHNGDFCLSDLYNTESLYPYYKSSAAALYSGIIPRLNFVEYSPPSMDNLTVEGLKLKLGRTSYFTMRGMGSAQKHPFLDKIVDFGLTNGCVTYAEINKSLDDYEIRVQNEYYKAIETLDKKRKNENPLEKKKTMRTSLENELEILNGYLQHSIAQHNINVSGNIITENGFCIYTKRAQNIEDSGDFYCSVNGGSEIYDSNVDFYKNSVKEDIPSIEYNNNNAYFGEELTREAIAELGLIDDSDIWNFYGLTVMGEKSTITGHRMSFHFNVLGEKRCIDKFEYIREQKGLSSENFESENIFGYKWKIYNSKRQFVKECFFDTFIPMVLDSKDFIILTAVMFLSFFVTKQSNSISIDDYFSVVFAIAYLTMLFHHIYQYYRKRKYEKTVRIILNDNSILNIEHNMSKIIKKLSIDSSIHMDNVFRLLTLMRFQKYFIQL